MPRNISCYTLLSGIDEQRRKVKLQPTTTTLPSWPLPGVKMAPLASHSIFGCRAARGRPWPARGRGPAFPGHFAKPMATPAHRKSEKGILCPALVGKPRVRVSRS
ncbi:hypothetical protein NN561_018919 [Cricetulus griseus]